MFLALDLGNSSTKGGLFALDGGIEAAPVATFTLKSPTEARLRAALRDAGVSAATITAAGLCSVVPKQTLRAVAAIEAVCGVTPGVVRADGPLPIGIAYETPSTLGADRIAAAVAAWTLFGHNDEGRPRAVIALDAGTAVTLEVVDALGTYLGGAILPGLRLQRTSLARGTAQLPSVPPVAPPSPIGRSTTTALQAGLVLGLLGALSSLLDRIAEQLGAPVFVVATGGSTPLLAQHLDQIDAVVPTLVLQGVRLLTDLNHR